MVHSRVVSVTKLRDEISNITNNRWEQKQLRNNVEIFRADGDRNFDSYTKVENKDFTYTINKLLMYSMNTS